MCLICADVLARGLLGRPISAAHELVSYSIVGAVYLQLANTLYVGRFTRAEMLITSLESNRPIAAAVFNSVFSLLGVIVFSIIVYGTYFKFTEAWPDLVFGNAAAFEILVWPLRAMIFVGALLTAIVYVFQFSEGLSGLFRLIARRRSSAQSQPVGWISLGFLAAAIALIALAAVSDLSRVQIGALSLIGIVIMICLGVHIAVGLIAVAFIGMWIMMGDTRIALNAVKLASNEFLRNYFLGVVPLFVLMGLLVNESGIGK
ncbi:MAG TPA: TRAP transporter small permease subunit, partial [Kiloniellaceae bacterium]|nr:TRAP transporter small permease subunit [Kiloniellaceae bacterium]